jgi:hypothetical protein
MNRSVFLIPIISLTYGLAVLAADERAATEKPAASVSATQAATVAVTSTNAEPTEAEMRAAVQHHLDGINAMMRAPSAPTSSGSRPYVYSPYWRYYGWGHGYKYSKESDYANWTDVARQAAATTRIEISSFKKINCAPSPDGGGFIGEYVAELEVRGNNPAAREIMQTSGKRLKGFFCKGDKGWIFGEPQTDAK